MKITEKFKTVAAVFAMVVLGVGGAALLPAGDANAARYTCPNGQVVTDATGSYEDACKTNDLKNSQESDLMSVLNTIINVVIGVIGFIAVVMIIVGGVQYTLSSGDSGKVTKAKNTIMYGIIGLVIALLAFAIVNFVLSNIFGNSTGTQ